MSDILYSDASCPTCGAQLHIKFQLKPRPMVLGLVDTHGVTTDTNHSRNPNMISVIYDFWNSHGIVAHRKMTPDIAKAIKAELKNYSDTEIMEAIKNYAEIYHGKQYWFKYAWTLRDFLRRGLPKFLDLSIAKNNYSHSNAKHQGFKTPDGDKYTKGKYGHMVQR